MESRPKGRKAGRVVRHVLKDGTQKEYTYSRYRPKPKPTEAGDNLGSVIAAFQRSPEWCRLADETRRHYIHYLRPLDHARQARIHDVRRRELLAIRDAIAASRGDGAATGFVRAASALLAWARDRGWIEYNPLQGGARGLAHGHLPAWTKEEAATAIDRLPEHLRRVVVLALHTGQRRGDLCAMTWAAYKGSAIKVVQEKTKEPVTIPCHPALKAELDAWAAGRSAVTILTDARGKPWKANFLSQHLPRALAVIGLRSGLNVHGLRKLAAANLAEAGCSMKEIAAITGHRSLSMIELYTRSADQERLASAAIARLSERKYKREN